VTPLKISIAILSAFALSFSANALSAKNTTKSSDTPEDLSIQKEIVNDGYFATAECDKYLDGFAMPEQDTLKLISRTFQAEDAIYYIAGGGSWTGGFEKVITSTKYSLSPALVEAKKKLGGKGVIGGYSDELYSEQKAKEATSSRKSIESNYAKGSVQQKNTRLFISCRVALGAIGMGVDANSFQGYVDYAESRKKEATIGHFKISADSAYYGASVNTGNQYAEPKKWEGSRFFVIRASFKNLDTESRLPVEGSLFINYNGKDYEFDSVEPIMLEGYNIWFKKINPLITMKTKIVYRIPDEIHGEVFWRPGRNSTDTKLWLGFISAAKND